MSNHKEKELVYNLWQCQKNMSDKYAGWVILQSVHSEKQ